jgi:DNA-binding NarL/FixJ family response regulator
LDTTTAMQHLEESEPKPLGTVRIECPYPLLALALKEILKGEAHLVYEGRKPRGAQEDDPACVILCPNGKDLAPEVRRLRTFMPDAAIMVFSVHMNPRVAQSALRAGASGLIHAGMRPEQIVRALRLASAGKIVLSESTVSRGLVESLVAENPPDLGALTPRQREILELVCEGLSNAQIAERLFLTESTVKQHLYAAYKLLNVRNRIQAANLLQEA